MKSERRRTSTLPRYEEIAIDIATKIHNREYKEGERLSGRSTLAGMYKVSPETIRRAIAILHDRGVVKAMAGSGIMIVSRSLAGEYLENLKTRTVILDLNDELTELLRQRRLLDAEIEVTLARLVQHATRSVSAATTNLDEVTIAPGSALIGQTLASADIRQLTGATVVAITREGEEYFSPGADMALQAGDLLLIAGSEQARDRLKRIVRRPKASGATSADETADNEVAETTGAKAGAKVDGED